MDKRSRKIVELLNKLQDSIGRGDVCAPYPITPGAAPDIEVTVEVKATGQVVKFHLWRADIEQWRDIDPLTKTPVAGPAHLKIVGDIAKTEQVSPPRKQEEPKAD